jgi:hypothetical protein
MDIPFLPLYVGVESAMIMRTIRVFDISREVLEFHQLRRCPDVLQNPMVCRPHTVKAYSKPSMMIRSQIRALNPILMLELIPLSTEFVLHNKWTKGRFADEFKG